MERNRNCHIEIKNTYETGCVFAASMRFFLVIFLSGVFFRIPEWIIAEYPEYF